MQAPQFKSSSRPTTNSSYLASESSQNQGSQQSSNTSRPQSSYSHNDHQLSNNQRPKSSQDRDRNQGNFERSVNNSERNWNKENSQSSQGNRQQKLPPRLANKYNKESGVSSPNHDAYHSRANTASNSYGGDSNKSYNDSEERYSQKGNFNRKQDFEPHKSAQKHSESVKRTTKPNERTNSSSSQPKHYNTQQNNSYTNHATQNQSMQFQDGYSRKMDVRGEAQREKTNEDRRNKGNYSNYSEPNWQGRANAVVYQNNQVWYQRQKICQGTDNFIFLLHPDEPCVACHKSLLYGHSTVQYFHTCIPVQQKD